MMRSCFSSGVGMTRGFRLQRVQERHDFVDLCLIQHDIELEPRHQPNGLRHVGHLAVMEIGSRTRDVAKHGDFEDHSVRLVVSHFVAPASC